ncbi:CLUMA_CG014429, isoform A [Clunio marinus]|uniref:CLUMA_CG014429, isoform A n=1 Tax=Clunio marinus TaxID=568069 RepID=A0A1J1ILQ7_9DIPT|nr:CLUMA_CG014429, isoform A [Clunio marinus]
MFKFLKNENKKKITDDNDPNDKTCTLEEVENIFCDSEPDSESVSSQIRLHRNINDILNDRTTLSFFIQYLETKSSLSFVKFWLDLEAFKALQNGHTPLLRLESRSSNYNSKAEVKHLLSNSNDDCCEINHDIEDCISVSTTSFTESNIDETEETATNICTDEVDHSKVVYNDDLERMTQSLTDDEKSKICEKNRKKEEEVAGVGDTELNKKKKLQPSILEDALRIYRKYLVTDSVYQVELPAEYLSKLSLALCDSEESEDKDEEKNTLLDAFEDAQKYVVDMMEKDFLSDFLESSFYSKYTVDVLTSESLSLREILYSESALFFFMEFLEQDKENCKLPYLEFWLSATNFQKQKNQHHELDIQQLKSDALVIYEKWFSLQAKTPLNFSNGIRTKVEEGICTIDSSITQCFDLPIKIVEIYLDRCCFKKFVKSQLFFKHLSEVINKIDGNAVNKSNNGIIRRNSSLSLNFPTKSRHRRVNSDIVEKKTIPRSISTQNTLLAGLDHKKNKNTTDLHIDSRQLADPDLLWRRKSSVNGLFFGRVDAFGRYERDFDLPSGSTSIPSSKSLFHLQRSSIDVDDPQTLLELDSTQNRFKNAVRKFVHLPEDSVQQEIAWQVAAMIVKDVTNITMHNNKSS